MSSQLTLFCKPAWELADKSFVWKVGSVINIDVLSFPGGIGTVKAALSKVDSDFRKNNLSPGSTGNGTVSASRHEELEAFRTRSKGVGFSGQFSPLISWFPQL